MKYLVTEWFHTSDEYPIRIYSEINDQRVEKRKIEVYIDGRVGFADEKNNVGGAVLAHDPMPSLEEINGSTELLVKELDAAKFGQIFSIFWNLYGKGCGNESHH